MSKRLAFRTGTEAAAPVRVDRAARTIFGVQVLQVGEAKGHGMLVDDVMVGQAVEAINATGDQGMKSRWTHPGLCANGMGKMLGRLRTARVQGDTAVADLHFADFASTSPDGDLATYAMDMAEQDPNACGMSIVFAGNLVWKLADGSEEPVKYDEDRVMIRPDGATTDKPFARITALSSVDLVDEPAATSGLLAAAFGRTSNTDAAAVFGQIDDLRQRLSLGMDDLHAFLDRYAAARGLNTPTPTPSQESPAMKHAAFAMLLIGQFAEHAAAITTAANAPEATEASIQTALFAAVKADTAAKIEAGKVELKAEQDAHTKTKADLAAANAKITALGGKVDQLAALGNAGPDAGGAPKDGPGAGLTGEAKWKAEFAASAELQKVFFADAIGMEKACAAYCFEQADKAKSAA